MSALVFLARLAALASAVALCGIGLDWRSPMLAGMRPAGLVVIVAGASALAVISARMLANARAGTLSRLVAMTTLGLAATGLAGVLAAESEHSRLRSEVLAADPAQLQHLGRHLITGYTDRNAVERLIEARAIGGVFITTRNVGRRSAKDIAEQISSWQQTRHAQGLPPLIIATDQEGGDVSRLSPPLARLPPLAVAVAKAHTSEGRKAAALDYGRRQGADLAGIGVTLNFAPVVDLNFGIRSRGDAYTRIFRRAIARDPAIVTEAAEAYCQGLAESGVACTLKHFPGLGRLTKDTHVAEARLDTPAGELEQADWVPFHTGARPASTLIMVGHVRVASIDPDQPASLSRKVVTGIIRQRWKHDGLLVTDDLSMRAAYASQPRWGLGAAGSAAVGALNAGVDLLLVGFDTEQVYPILAALLLAERDGRLDAATLAESDRRLERP